MSISSDAFTQLYPGRQDNYDFKIKYSGKFRGFNANVYYGTNKMEFRLARAWKEVSRDIKIGLLQSLMVKVIGEKKSTVNIDLYNIFLKKVHVAAPRTDEDPELKRSFDRVNSEYFDNIMEAPNLRFGQKSTRKAGSYDYGSDMIIISSVLRGREDLIDYVMYHELLHKKFKYNVKNGRSYHHTREFREAERQFNDQPTIEKKLSALLTRKKIFPWF